MSAVSPSYPISTPVEFTITSGGDGLLFNAEGFTTGDSPTQNIVTDFVVECPGDMMYRNLGGTANTLERLPIGVPGDILAVGGSSAVAQVQTIDTIADTANNQDGTYFLLNSPGTGYYVWISTGAGAPDPGLMPGADLFIPPGSAHGRIAIPVTIATGATADAVATATRTAINTAPFSTDFTASGATNEVVITNLKVGIADAVVPGLIPPAGPFLYNAGTTTAPVTGVSPSFGWAVPTPGSVGETFLAEATASTASSIAAGSTWVPLTAGEVTWNDTTLPNHDAGGIFTPATGVFVVPSTGIYAISANVTFEANNSGNGGGGISGRRAIRQARIRNTTTGATMAFGETQARPVNIDPPQISIVVAAVSVTAADVIEIQVRHDASVSLAISVDEDGTPTQGPATYFTANRVA